MAWDSELTLCQWPLWCSTSECLDWLSWSLDLYWPRFQPKWVHRKPTEKKGVDTESNTRCMDCLTAKGQKTNHNVGPFFWWNVMSTEHESKCDRSPWLHCFYKASAKIHLRVHTYTRQLKNKKNKIKYRFLNFHVAILFLTAVCVDFEKWFLRCFSLEIILVMDIISSMQYNLKFYKVQYLKLKNN